MDPEREAEERGREIDNHLIAAGLRSLAVTTGLAACLGLGLWLYAQGRPIEAFAVIWLAVVAFALMGWRVLTTGRWR